MRIQFRNRNLDSAVVAGAGGLVILYVGLIGLKLVLFGGDSTTLDITEVVAGTLWGSLITAFSILLVVDLKRNHIYGAAIVLLSFASWYGTSGGLFIGFVLAFLGGVMGYGWKPKQKSAVEKRTAEQTSP